jgi:serine protease
MKYRMLIISTLILSIVCTWGCGSGGNDLSSIDNIDIPSNSKTVSLSGTITVPTNVAVDSDVNDPKETYIANDTAQTAQVLDNPISVGGYVNQAGTGSSGQSFDRGDLIDCFSAALRGADMISLFIGDTENSDLDLFLLDANGELIDSSQGTGAQETITVPADGTYFIAVTANSGASNYILTIGVDVAGQAVGDSLSIRHDFTLDEAIVLFEPDLQTADTGASQNARAADMGMMIAAGGKDREMLLSFAETNSQDIVYKAIGTIDQPSTRQILSDAFGRLDEKMRRKLDTLDSIKALRQRGDVRLADPNYVIHLAAMEPNDQYYPLQWHYPLINLPQAWDITTGSFDVIVAVVDSGVLLDHPDLAGQLTDTGYDFVSNPTLSNDGDGIDPNPDDPGNGDVDGSIAFHGTICAGIIAATSDNGTGVAGVSWNSSIMPVRVLGVGGTGSLINILQGVRYAAGLENDSGTVPAQPADIINLSMAGTGYSEIAQEVFTRVREAGIIVIAAAGNEATATPQYPASYDGVISVSAVDINSEPASYSSYGSYVDVAAPGGDVGDVNADGYYDYIVSTYGDTSEGSIRFGYTMVAGTSMAAPHVAGVVALMKAVYPALTPEILDALLQNGVLTKDNGETGWDDNFGYGLIDAYKAVLAVNNGNIPSLLTVSPTTIKLGETQTSASLTVSSIGETIVSVSDFTQSPTEWLTVTQADVDANGRGVYTISANRSGLSNADYNGTIMFTASSGNIISVQVNLNVDSSDTTANAGYHYVLLLDSTTKEIVQQVDMAAVNAEYAYTFNEVAAGESYLIVAGSDRDNDGIIGDDGESSGVYSFLDQIIQVKADGDTTGLNFTTNMRLTRSPSFSSIDSAGESFQFMRLDRN